VVFLLLRHLLGDHQKKLPMFCLHPRQELAQFTQEECIFSKTPTKGPSDAARLAGLEGLAANRVLGLFTRAQTANSSVLLYKNILGAAGGSQIGRSNSISRQVVVFDHRAGVLLQVIHHWLNNRAKLRLKPTSFSPGPALGSSAD
jgi:hypothetical protein